MNSDIEYHKNGFTISGKTAWRLKGEATTAARFYRLCFEDDEKALGYFPQFLKQQLRFIKDPDERAVLRYQLMQIRHSLQSFSFLKTYGRDPEFLDHYEFMKSIAQRKL